MTVRDNLDVDGRDYRFRPMRRLKRNGEINLKKNYREKLNSANLQCNQIFLEKNQ